MGLVLQDLQTWLTRRPEAKEDLAVVKDSVVRRAAKAKARAARARARAKARETRAKRSGTGIVAAPVPKKVLKYAGVNDCFSSSRGATSTGGNFVKAVFAAIKATYAYNMPDIWEQAALSMKKPPFQEFTDHL